MADVVEEVEPRLALQEEYPLLAGLETQARPALIVAEVHRDVAGLFRPGALKEWRGAGLEVSPEVLGTPQLAGVAYDQEYVIDVTTIVDRVQGP